MQIKNDIISTKHRRSLLYIIRLLYEIEINIKYIIYTLVDLVISASKCTGLD